MNCYKPFHLQLNAYCFALCRNSDEAKDLMGNTIEIAYSKFEQLNDKAKFKYFLFGIASRLYNNERRKWQKKTFVELDELNTLACVESGSDVQTDAYYLHKALKQLPPASSEALLLFELEGFSIREIADIQNSNENTVKSRLSRGREQLRALLNPSIKQL